MLGITTSLQNTDIPRFQAKRKNVEGYIGTGFVDNADDSERYRYFFDILQTSDVHSRIEPVE